MKIPVTINKDCQEDYVSKSDFENFRIEQSKEHLAITNNQKLTDKKLDALAPLVELIPDLQASVRLKKSTDVVVGSLKGKAKTAAIFLGVVAVIITIVNGGRELIVFWSARLK